MATPERTDTTVGTTLADATDRLRIAGSPTPRLDAEVLVAHVAGRDRAWVLAHPEADLELAAENLALHGVEGVVTLACADLLGQAGGSLPLPDVVVANLPYVASAEVDARQGSLGYEPRVALDGGLDGLALLRRLLEELPARAAPGAVVFLEIGVGQVDVISDLAPAGWRATVVPDLAGLDRVVR